MDDMNRTSNRTDSETKNAAGFGSGMQDKEFSDSSMGRDSMSSETGDSIGSLPPQLSALLEKIGINETMIKSVRDSVENVDLQQWVTKARTYAKENPAVVVGALSALVIGGGLLARGMSTQTRS